MDTANDIKGRVITVRKLGKNLFFLVIHSSGKLIEAIYEKPDFLPKKGDFIIANGFWKKKEKRNELEYYINSFEFQIRPLYNSNLLFETLDQRRIEALSVRSITESQTHKFFNKKDFKLINSPVLVSDWVMGQTKAFSVNGFSGKICYLSISSILYHQIVQAKGYDKIYEIARLFRKDNSTSKKRLAEFSNIVLSIIDSNLINLIKIFEEYISELHYILLSIDNKFLNLPKDIKFEIIDYRELLSKCGHLEITGHQLPLQVRNYLDKTYSSFVWITGFPKNTRPFYVKSIQDFSDDCQLWYKGRNYIATGGIIETNPEIIKKNIVNDKKNVKVFNFYIDALEMGLPTIANMDMGLERLLGCWFENSISSEFAFFPRFKDNII